MKKKEGLIGMLFHVPPEELLTLFQKDQVDFLQVESGGDHSGAAVVRVEVIREVSLVDRLLRRNGNSVTLDVGIQPVGGGTAGSAKELGRIRDGREHREWPARSQSA